MDFSFSEDQIAIRELAYQIFTDRATDEFLLDFYRNDDAYDQQLWQTLAEQGLLGIALPEAVGGSGLGFTELCLVLEEQGKRVAPVPLLANIVSAAIPITRYGSKDQHEKYLAPLAEGSIKLAAAIAELGMDDALHAPVNAKKTADGWTLQGRRECVADGDCANFLLVPAQDEQGQHSVFVVDTNARGVHKESQDISLLGAWSANFDFDNVELGDDALLGEAGQGDDILQCIEQHTQVAQCALQVGVTEEAMRRTAAYTCERKQFGVPIGSFQALAMRMADSYIDVESIRSTYWLALSRLSEGLPAAAESRIAKWWACEAAHRVVHTSQHLHGGIGADIEYPIHRFFMWAKQISYNLGGGAHQLDQLGKLLAADDSVGYAAIEA